LDRDSRGVVPTLYGQSLLRRALAIFDELRQGVKEIEFLADPTAGEVRVGCPEAHAAGLLPAVIQQLRRKYPGIVCEPSGCLRLYQYSSVNCGSVVST
jgi:DNA-binding transcriptional LysR family regulator